MVCDNPKNDIFPLFLVLVINIHVVRSAADVDCLVFARVVQTVKPVFLSRNIVEVIIPVLKFCC